MAMMRASFVSGFLSRSKAHRNKPSQATRHALQGQASRDVLRLAMALFAVTSPLVLAPDPASAACITTSSGGVTNIVCTGADGNLTFNAGNLIAAGDSLKVNLGQGVTPSTVTGNVTATLNNGKDVVIDLSPISGVNANGGNAIGGDATGAGNVTINAGGDVTNLNGRSVFATIVAGTGNIAVTTGGNVTATAGNAIDAQHFGAGVSNSGVTVNTAAGKTIQTTGGSGIVASLQLAGSGGITVNNNSALKVSGGTGISAIRNNTSTGDVTVTNSGAIGSGAGGPNTFNLGIQAAANPGANGNVTVNLTKGGDIGTAADRAQFAGITVNSGGAAMSR
jgi:hypothetical protein